MNYDMHDCDICGNIYASDHCPTCGAFKVLRVHYNYLSGRKMCKARGAFVVLAHELHKHTGLRIKTELCDARG